MSAQLNTARRSPVPGTIEPRPTALESESEEMHLDISARPGLKSKNDGYGSTWISNRNGTSNTPFVKEQLLLPDPPYPPESREFFRAIQKWEGHVTEVGEECFRAVIIPILGDGPALEAEIFKEEIPPDDYELIEVGAVFYWSIGYLDRPSGRLNASTIRFRRLPAWTERKIEKASAEAERLQALFEND